jgi:hypothetical protein
MEMVHDTPLPADTAIGEYQPYSQTSYVPPMVDVGHLRLNLFFNARDLAELFTETWQRLTANTYDPWADVVAVIGMLDNPRATPPNHRARTTIEDALAAVAVSP